MDVYAAACIFNIILVRRPGRTRHSMRRPHMTIECYYYLPPPTVTIRSPCSAVRFFFKKCSLPKENDETQNRPFVVVSLFWLIFLILAGVFPLDAFKTLYDFDHFVIFAFKTNTF